MNLAAQAKLLRFLQEREFQRLGGTRLVKADVRVIAAQQSKPARGGNEQGDVSRGSVLSPPGLRHSDTAASRSPERHSVAGGVLSGDAGRTTGNPGRVTPAHPRLRAHAGRATSVNYRTPLNAPRFCLRGPIGPEHFSLQAGREVDPGTDLVRRAPEDRAGVAGTDGNKSKAARRWALHGRSCTSGSESTGSKGDVGVPAV